MSLTGTYALFTVILFCSHPVNASKNRYADVLSLEHSRVKLTVIHEDDVSFFLFICKCSVRFIVHNLSSVFRLYQCKFCGQFQTG